MIRIHITGEDDLFDRYDADRNTLNPSVISYVSKKFDRKMSDGTICIQSDIPIDQAQVRIAVAQYLDATLEKNRLQRRRNRLIELYLLIIGVVCIVAGILLKDAGTVYLQILSLTAGFAIKEAATIFFMKNPKNTLERARILLISKSELRFEAYPAKKD